LNELAEFTTSVQEEESRLEQLLGNIEKMKQDMNVIAKGNSSSSQETQASPRIS